MSELDQFIVPLVKCPQGAGLHDTRSITCPYCELTKLRAFVKDARVMAEFYANVMHWERSFDMQGKIQQEGTIEDDYSDCGYTRLKGGLRAREFLSKHSELIKGEA
jgi:hypothetical protein